MNGILLVALLSLASATAQASSTSSSSCSVANNHGSCNITCTNGRAAICRFPDDAAAPKCYCATPPDDSDARPGGG